MQRRNKCSEIAKIENDVCFSVLGLIVYWIKFKNILNSRANSDTEESMKYKIQITVLVYAGV